MNETEWHEVIEAWLVREFADDKLLAGEVEGYNVQRVRPPNEARLVHTVRAEFVVDGFVAAADRLAWLQRRDTEQLFPHRIGAALLDDATRLQPGPASVYEAAQQFRVGLVGAVAPKWRLEGRGGEIKLPVPVMPSKAVVQDVVLVYTSRASYQVWLHPDVRRTVDGIHILVAATITATARERACIARVKLPTHVP